MKALVFHNKQMQLRADLPTPEPGAGEALVRVSVAGICATDLEIVKGYMGFEGVLGHEFVGVVASCGQPDLCGRRVVGEINVGCGECLYCEEGLDRHCPSRSVLGILGKDGAFAEYLTLPVKNLHLVPGSVADDEAVFVEPLAAAFEILEQIDIGPEERVCVLGDGRLGLLVAQVLALATSQLTVVGKHPEKLSILAEKGINTELASAGTHERTFDLIVDCTGSAAGLEQALLLVRPRGKIVLKTTVASSRPCDLNQLVIDEIALIGSRCGPFAPALRALAEKKVDVTPLISRKFNLAQGPEALNYAGQKGVLKVLLEI